MEAKRLSSKWIDLIMKIVTSGKVVINVNGAIGTYFSTHQGVRHGTHSHPFSLTLM
jgi:hypothetical protein